MRRRAALALVPLAVLSLLLVGCGDDGKKEASPTTTTEESSPTTAEDGTEDDTTTSGTGTTEDDSTTSSTTTAPGTPGPSSADEDFCPGFEALTQLFTESPGDTLDQMKASTVDFAEESAALVAIAPADLADDMQVMADFFADLRDAVADAPTMEEAQARAQSLSTPEFNTAGATIDGWVTENCP